MSERLPEAQYLGDQGRRGWHKVQGRSAIQRVLIYIDEHLPEVLEMGQLSRVAGLHERTFYYYFRCVCGTSPKQYILERRLSRVKSILEHDPEWGRSVKAAALTTGFRDLGRFSQYYFTKYGEHPSETLRHGSG